MYYYHTSSLYSCVPDPAGMMIFPAQVDLLNLSFHVLQALYLLQTLVPDGFRTIRNSDLELCHILLIGWRITVFSFSGAVFLTSLRYIS